MQLVSNFYLYFKLSQLRIMEQSENEMIGAFAGNF